MLAKKWIILGFCAAWICTFSGNPVVGYTQTTNIKMGCIDLFQVYSKCAKFQKLKTDLQQLKQSKTEKLQQMESNFKSELEKFKAEQEFLPAPRVQEKKEKLQSEQEKLYKTAQTEMESFDKAREDKFEPLMKEVLLVIESIAKEEGYAFIFRLNYIAYVDPKYDITAKVIERLNKK